MHTQWKNLPFEVQEMVVKRSVESTRNALRACSSKNKKLVEDTRLDSIHCLTVYGDQDCDFGGSFIAFFKRESLLSCGYQYHQTCASFEEQQAEFASILESVDCVKKLDITYLASDMYIPMKRGQRLLVETFVLVTRDAHQAKKILSQIEPGYLRELDVCLPWKHATTRDAKIFDMPQILNSEKLKIGNGTSLREDQLMKFKARNLFVSDITCPLKNYVKKCIREASTKPIQFGFSRNAPFSGFKPSDFSETLEWKTIKTCNPKVKFLIQLSKKKEDTIFRFNGKAQFDYDQAVVHRNNRSLSSLGIIGSIRVHQNFDEPLDDWVIAIEHGAYSIRQYILKSNDELREKLDKLLECVDYIRVLDFWLTKKQFAWKPKRRLTVGKIWYASSGECSLPSISTILERIDPNYLKYVEVHTEMEENAIFETPQVQNAKFVEIDGSYCRDEQLLKMNGDVFCNIRAHRPEKKSKFITAAGINQYIKKCVLRLNEKDCNFQFYPLEHNDEEMLFRNLDVLSRQPFRSGTLFLIDSPYPQFILAVSSLRRGVFGKRILRDQEVLKQINWHVPSY